MARAAGIDVVLWVAGAGDTSRFAAKARDLGAEEYVTFLGGRRRRSSSNQRSARFVVPATRRCRTGRRWMAKQASRSSSRQAIADGNW